MTAQMHNGHLSSIFRRNDDDAMRSDFSDAQWCIGADFESTLN